MASRQMLTVHELMDKTPLDVRQRSRQTRFSVTKVWKKALKYDKTAICFQSNAIAATEKIYYDQTIVLYPDYYEVKNEEGEDVKQFEVPSLDHLVWLHCSCPFFLFNVAWVLTQHGNSSLGNCLNKPPHITNPNQIPYVCKHLYKGLPEVIRMMQSITNKKVQK